MLSPKTRPLGFSPPKHENENAFACLIQTIRTTHTTVMKTRLKRAQREREHAAFPKAPNVMKALKPVCLLAEAKELPPAVLWEYNFLNRENYNSNMLQFAAASERRKSKGIEYT